MNLFSKYSNGNQLHRIYRWLMPDGIIRATNIEYKNIKKEFATQLYAMN